MGCSRLQRAKQAAVTALALPSPVLRLQCRRLYTVLTDTRLLEATEVEAGEGRRRGLVVGIADGVFCCHFAETGEHNLHG